ncbi:glycoside hydrolase family 79 protein [Trametes versicolor FP-101664 SS1]|uniref:glycoside hydrolase family 79 protein n=1 Tax=Trametes versicolor (strain FP-101664) TaxID=717944 RepID=UPI00046248C5|nr:glycoside hydrolase family 79 protein [Trametes versicolor FP-101664 SS1]EIW61463.1 glycoside hydrolase family 79 protein [Trametes versicolor FP-101664 SS1]
MARSITFSRPFAALLCLIAPLYIQTAHAAVAVASPASPPPANANVVYSNFMGVSLELSFINYYFGNSTDQIPQPVVSYLSALQTRGSGKPVRLRLGGNSMDSSTYVPSQPDIIEFTDPNANSNDQPVNYGPQLFDVMKGVSTAVGGAQFLIGLSLRTPNSTNIPLLAGDAETALGDDLDAFLLGNEPDLYTAHGNRPNLQNYTTNDYIGDYATVFGALQDTPKGDVLSQDKIAGPTICCFWDLASVLQSGWLDKYADRLKYITLQHYPQNNCQGKPQYGIDYYTSHANAVGLAQWQQNGLDYIAGSPNRKPVLMDEFSSASCGGVPGISDTFAASLWEVDYALQMALTGYAGAYLHTRERGVTYNLFDPPDAVAGGAGAWTTNPSFYGMLPVAEALQAANGSRVVDLNLANSIKDTKATAAGYAIYDGSAPTVHSLVMFNFANASGAMSDYTIDASLVPSNNTDITIRYLTAPSVNEKTNIAWGGKTYAGVGDGVAVDATFSSSVPDKTTSCAGGCTIQVPGPGLAVVFLGGVPTISKPANTSPNSTAGGASPSGSAAASHTGGASRSSVVSLGALAAVLLAACTML